VVNGWLLLRHELVPAKPLPGTASDGKIPDGASETGVIGRYICSIKWIGSYPKWLFKVHVRLTSTAGIS
jgi:hypothetical protein